MKVRALLIVSLAALTFAVAGCGNNADNAGSGGAANSGQPAVKAPAGGGAPSTGPAGTKPATAPTN